MTKQSSECDCFMLYSSDMAKKNLIMLNLQSDSIDEKIAIDLGQNNYSFCTYNDEIYMACKSGIYALDGNESVKKWMEKYFLPTLLMRIQQCLH